MNNEQNLLPNDLDSLIGDNHLRMMKAALPFMNVSQQRAMSFFVKFNELRRTIDLFEEGEVAAMGICSAGESERQTNSSPIDMLNTIKPYANHSEQDFIDLIINFFQGFQLAESCKEPVPSSTVPSSTVPNNTVTAQNTSEEKNSSPPPKQSSNPFARMPFEQIKRFLPPEQQSRLETMQLMMSAMQQMN